MRIRGTICNDCKIAPRYLRDSFCLDCKNKRRQIARKKERERVGNIEDLHEIIDGTLHTEQWKDINGYGGTYQISDFGRVKSFFAGINKLHGKIINPMMCRGYQYIVLYKNKKNQNHYVHRLVAIHFIPNPENKPEVNHIGKDHNGVVTKLDNRYFSIEWATRKENEDHKFANGLAITGEKSHLSKLKDNDIYYIRESNKSNGELAKIFGVNKNHICSIKNYRSWKHLPKK